MSTNNTRRFSDEIYDSAPTAQYFLTLKLDKNIYLLIQYETIIMIVLTRKQHMI